MGEFHDVPNSGNEFIHLPVRNHQRRCNFQNHEIISTNLGKNAVVTKQTHNQDLTEHSGMDLRECLEWNSQAQAARNGEFNPEQSTPRDRRSGSPTKSCVTVG
jgi:hypothetical protein